MTKMTLPMAGMPSVITESFRSVLAAHGYVLARAETLCGPPFVQVVALNDATTEAVLREAGNNTAMALWSIDETLESEESPAHSANDFAVPKNWPRCPHCGDPTATGQITCGRTGCRERYESPAPPPSGVACEERDGAAVPPPEQQQAAPSRSSCEVVP